MKKTIIATVALATAVAAQAQEAGRQRVEGELAQLLIVGRQVQGGDFALRDDVGEGGHDGALDLAFDAFHGHQLGGAEDLLEEDHRVLHTEGIDAERAQPDHAELGVPPEVYTRFFWVVRDAFRDQLGAEWTPAYEVAWNGLLKELEVVVHA